ncbi:P-loop containing nucleoside triphosphate hydrolase protein [Chlamydoabsidia padenii]|nr:P-loop containing nucleoside triphosphate hydrolase protein [Chlamydoabsidia padenii]
MESDSQSIVVVWILMVFMGSCPIQVLSTVSSWSQAKNQFVILETLLAQGGSTCESSKLELVDDGGKDGMTRPKTRKSVCASELYGVTLQLDGITILSNVSIRIPHGKWIGLMGKSGSGKSMVLQTLLYMHGRHQSGQILVNDQPLVISPLLSRTEQDRCLVRWRQHFGLVDQDPRFFPISIHDNVALGSMSANTSRAQVEHACQLANIHDHIISLPKGYNTILDEDGTSFSSGQQRLLALARALIREPKLLLLDDITGALDDLGTRLIHQTLQELVGKGLSILMVSHDSLLLGSTDQVYEMDQGTVVKIGQYGYL